VVSGHSFILHSNSLNGGTGKTCLGGGMHCPNVITFHVRHSRGEVYIGHACLCVCLSLAAFPHYCTDPDVTGGSGRGAI